LCGWVGGGGRGRGQGSDNPHKILIQFSFHVAFPLLGFTFLLFTTMSLSKLIHRCLLGSTSWGKGGGGLINIGLALGEWSVAMGTSVV
jgi:hypothetical protein